MSRTRSSRNDARRTERGRSSRSASAGEAQSQVVESFDRLVEGGVENAGDRPQIVASHSEHSAVEVLSLHLDHLQVPHEHLRRFGFEVAQTAEIDRDGDTRVARARLGEVEHVRVNRIALLPWKELIDG